MSKRSTELRIIDVCEPVFLYVCELNRLGREGVHQEFSAVRHRVNELLDQCQETASVSNRLAAQWKEIEPALCCFLDSMIEDANLSCSREWAERRLAEEKCTILSGDDTFFVLLDDELEQKDTNGEVRERLEFYYACLRLGFAGRYQDDPDQLNRYNQRVAGRVQHLLKKGVHDLFTPDAYEHTDRRPLNMDTAPAAWGVVILTGTFLIFFFVLIGFFYKSSARNLESAIETIHNFGEEFEGGQ